MGWTDISNDYSIEERTFKDKYLEFEEEYNDNTVVNVFKMKKLDNMYTIYINYYNKLSGVVYVKEDELYKVLDDIKLDLEKDNEEDSKDFFAYFKNKYDLKELPDDFFDEDEEIKELKLNNMRLEFNLKNEEANKSTLKLFYIILSLFGFCLILGFSIIDFSNIKSIYYEDLILPILSLILFVFIAYSLYYQKLSIKNYEVIVTKDKIYYTNTFGTQEIYNINDISYYTEKTYSSEFYRERYSFTVIKIVFKDKSKVTISNACNNENVWSYRSDLIDYLDQLGIEKK